VDNRNNLCWVGWWGVCGVVWGGRVEKPGGKVDLRTKNPVGKKKFKRTWSKGGRSKEWGTDPLQPERVKNISKPRLSERGIGSPAGAKKSQTVRPEGRKGRGSEKRSMSLRTG